MTGLLPAEFVARMLQDVADVGDGWEWDWVCDTTPPIAIRYRPGDWGAIEPRATVRWGVWEAKVGLDTYAQRAVLFFADGPPPKDEVERFRYEIRWARRYARITRENYDT